MQLKFSLALSLSQVGLILSSPLVPSNDVILASIAMRDISLPIAKRVPGELDCNIDTPVYTGQALVSAIKDGVDYLNNLGGQATVGSHQASRVSCIYDSAIFVVNNGPGSVTIDYSWIAGLAGDVLGRCYDGDVVNGQQYDSAGYVVVVASAYC